MIDDMVAMVTATDKVASEVARALAELNQVVEFAVSNKYLFSFINLRKVLLTNILVSL